MRETLNSLNEPCHQKAPFTIGEGHKAQRRQVSYLESPAVLCAPRQTSVLPSGLKHGSD